MPVSVSTSLARPPCDERRGDPGEVGRAGRAVDQREPVEQRRRADRADDQVLQPRLERVLAAHFGRAQHVQRDRQQLEADEQRDRVLRRREQRHAGDRGQQQRVELAVRRFARRQRAPRQQHRAGAARRTGSASATSVRSSMRSAPETIGLLRVPLPDRQPERRAERDRASAPGTTCVRAQREREQADHQHEHRAAEQRDRAARAPRSRCAGPLRWAVARR